MQIVVAIEPAIRKGGNEGNAYSAPALPSGEDAARWIAHKIEMQGKSGIFAPVDLLYDQLFPVRARSERDAKNVGQSKFI